MNRLQEIETRLSAIKAELETDGADVAALSQETDQLFEERKGILAEIETRKATLEKVAQIPLEQGEEIIMTEEVRTFGIDSAEYRTAWLKNVRGLELNEVEKRAFTSASASAGAAIPTQTADEIIKKMKQYAPLLNEVTLLQVAGNVTFAVEDTVADADIHTENATITGATDKLKPVTLSAYEVTKLVQVSKTVATMSIDAFEEWLVDMLAQKVSEKISGLMISGTGSSQATGIDKAQTWGATNSVSVAKTGSLTAANVNTLIGLLNGGYDNGAKFLMSKKTLFNDFMPLQDESKNKLVIAEGGNYYIQGYPVLLHDGVTEHEAYLGNFKKAMVANLSEAVNVTSGFDIDTNSYKYLGCAMFDSKIGVAEAVVKLVKATA